MVINHFARPKVGFVFRKGHKKRGTSHLSAPEVLEYPHSQIK